MKRKEIIKTIENKGFEMGIPGKAPHHYYTFRYDEDCYIATWLDNNSLKTGIRIEMTDPEGYFFQGHIKTIDDLKKTFELVWDWRIKEE